MLYLIFFIFIYTYIIYSTPVKRLFSLDLILLYPWFPIIVIIIVFLLLFIFIEWWRQRWSGYECGPGLAKRIYRKRGCCIYSWWRHPNKSSGSCPKLCEYKRNYFYFFFSSFVLLLYIVNCECVWRFPFFLCAGKFISLWVNMYYRRFE